MSSSELQKTQPKYTPEEFQKSLSIERQVLRKLRSAYEILQDVQSLLDGNEDLLNRTSSYLTWDNAQAAIDDDGNYQSYNAVEFAMQQLDSIGGQLYARMNTPFPEPLDGQDEPTDEQMDAHMDREQEYAELWIDEGTPESEHICDACREKRDAAAVVA